MNDLLARFFAEDNMRQIPENVGVNGYKPQAPQMSDAEIKAAMLAHDYQALDQNNTGLQDAYSPFDAVTGGVAGVMTAPVKSLGRFMVEAALDPITEVAMQAAARDDSQNAMFIGKRGMKNLGIDAGKDLAGQLSFLSDRLPRLEIDDSAAKIGDHGTYSWASEAMPHEKLYNAYPDLGGVDVRFITDGGGSYTPRIDRSSEGLFDLTEEINVPKLDKNETLPHELQHAIQEREGFARGGNPSLFDDAAVKRQAEAEYDLLFETMQANPEKREEILPLLTSLRKQARYGAQENYQRLAGEIEARDTAARMNLSPEERMRTQPLSSFALRPDGTFGPTYEQNPIALDDFIVRHDTGENLSLPMDEASRMQRAKEQNYTSGLYRGGRKAADGAFYTPDEKAAEKFAARFNGGDVREYAIAKGNTFRMDKRYKPEELGKMKNALEKSGAKNLADYLDEIIADDFGGAIPARNLWQMLTVQTGGDTNAFRVLQESGFDTLDAGQEVVTLRPQKEIVRDAKKAMFDPKRKGEPNIFASLLPLLAAGGAGYLTNDDSL